LTVEKYLELYHKLYGLEYIILRYANVYGERQGDAGEGGVISIFARKIRNSEPVDIFGDGGQTRDFIYVEDLSDAIYKSLESNYCGIMNLSTDTEKSLNTLVQVLEGMHPTKGVIYQAPRNGDISRSRLGNSRIKEILHWNPKYTFSDGIEKTYQWYLAERTAPAK
jgi:nucleoside-diphosphate-sugar epimerase